MTRVIDSHVHLDAHQFQGEVDEIIQRAREAGVAKMIQIGCNLESSQYAIDLSRKHESIFPAIGFHPSDLEDYDENEAAWLKLVAQPEVIAIGEIGLDYHWNHFPHEEQNRIFLRQIDIAKQFHKPIIIHDRDAHGDMIEILRKEAKLLKGGVMHCFSGSWEMAKLCLQWGFYISFAGPLTFPKSNKLKEIASLVPLDRVLIETDCPYLAPQAFRGKRNEPAYVVEQAKAIASIRQISYDEAANQISLNTETLFNLVKP
jgi:TatD DNase family protein